MSTRIETVEELDALAREAQAFLDSRDMTWEMRNFLRKVRDLHRPDAPAPSAEDREALAREVTRLHFDLLRDDAPRGAIRDAGLASVDAVLAARAGEPAAQTVSATLIYFENLRGLHLDADFDALVERRQREALAQSLTGTGRCWSTWQRTTSAALDTTCGRMSDMNPRWLLQLPVKRGPKPERYFGPWAYLLLRAMEAILYSRERRRSGVRH